METPPVGIAMESLFGIVFLDLSNPVREFSDPYNNNCKSIISRKVQSKIET